MEFSFGEGIGILGRMRTRTFVAHAVLVVLTLAISAPTPAAAQQQLGQQLQSRSVNTTIEAGWRYAFAGHSRVPGDGFPQAYHAAWTLTAGSSGGLYVQGRFDGYGPRTRGTFPFVAGVRVGYFLDVHEFDPGGLRSSTNTRYSTECGYATCTTYRHTTTRSWWEPAGWIHGIRYFFVGYRQGFDLEGDRDEITGNRELTMPGAVSLGIGLIESKFGTFLNEVELLYWPFGWDDPDRTRWGFAYRGAVLFGPVLVDVNVMLDSGLGGELSVGLGFMFSP